MWDYVMGASATHLTYCQAKGLFLSERIPLQLVTSFVFRGMKRCLPFGLLLKKNTSVFLPECSVLCPGKHFVPVHFSWLAECMCCMYVCMNVCVMCMNIYQDTVQACIHTGTYIQFPFRLSSEVTVPRKLSSMPSLLWLGQGPVLESPLLKLSSFDSTYQMTMEYAKFIWVYWPTQWAPGK